MASIVKSGFVIDAASLGGSEHANQDAWDMHNDVLWVLDGATSPNTSDGLTVTDFVQSLSGALYEEASGNKSLKHILRSGLERLVDDPTTHAGYSATVAMVKKSSVGWEWLVLGDAAVVIDDGQSRPQLVSDQRLAAVAQTVRMERRKLKNNPEAVDRFNELSAELRRQESLMRNTKEGFWVAGAVPEAAEQSVVGVAKNSAKIFLMTDGVTDGLNTQYWKSLRTAIADWEVSGAENSLQRMHHGILDSIGVVDDATLVSVRDNG